MRIVRHEQLKADSVLRRICEEIVRHDKSDQEWADVESGDLFQEGDYSGGYDAIEQEFLFSYYRGDKEYWLSFDLPTAGKVAAGEERWFDLIDPEVEGLK